jgi:mono/diheme cytochrome c family protein
MKTLALVVGLMSGAAVAADAKFELKGDAAKGESIFKALCVSCHGEKGQGDGPASAALTPKPANFTDPVTAERLTPEHVYRTIKEGGAAVGRSSMMVAWAGTLKEDQLRDVAAYVLQFKPAPAKKPAPKR